MTACELERASSFITPILLATTNFESCSIATHTQHAYVHRAIEMGFKNLCFLGFLTKNLKTSKVQPQVFKGFKKAFKNLDFRFAVTAEIVAFRSN